MKKKYPSLLHINFAPAFALAFATVLFLAGFLPVLGARSVQAAQAMQAVQTVHAALTKQFRPTVQAAQAAYGLEGTSAMHTARLIQPALTTQTAPLTQWLAASKPALSGAEILKLVTDGRYQEAQTLALARITEMPNDIDAYVALSWSLLALGKTEDAANYAQRGYAIYKDPRLAEAIGEASYNLGKNDVALSMLQEYIAAYPEGPKTGLSYYLCGELYVRKAQFMHADIAFSTAVRYNPNNPLWWTRLGWARENAHRPLQALSAYEQALILNPNFQDAIEGRKRILSRLQQ
jgi:tetratricopeptide (TPR) repeat protein